MTAVEGSTKVLLLSSWVCIPARGRAVPLPSATLSPTSSQTSTWMSRGLRASMPGRTRTSLPLNIARQRCLLTFSPFLTGCADKPHPTLALTISNHNVSSQLWETLTLLPLQNGSLPGILSPKTRYFFLSAAHQRLLIHSTTHRERRARHTEHTTASQTARTPELTESDKAAQVRVLRSAAQHTLPPPLTRQTHSSLPFNSNQRQGEWAQSTHGCQIPLTYVLPSTDNRGEGGAEIGTVAALGGKGLCSLALEENCLLRSERVRDLGRFVRGKHISRSGALRRRNHWWYFKKWVSDNPEDLSLQSPWATVKNSCDLLLKHRRTGRIMW